MPATQTKIDFNNTLSENDEFNIIEYLYFYNGAGVATGDLNNDGLTDIYFVSNQQSNKLYLNKGKFEFEDITNKAGVAGVGNWKTGVTMADVNGDDFLDIFICGVGKYKSFNGRNQLLINNGDLTFTDRTEEYGLSFQGFSTQASFFDYDNDGDLDMYLLNHAVRSIRSYGDVSLRYQSDPLSGDKLYRNDVSAGGEIKFTEVTSQAGIYSSQIGYGLGVGISDINNDGYLDIYIGNDFQENDYLYINQGNGTFKQVLELSMPHSTRFSMGNDIADINNDGWFDILSLDMQPNEEAIIKTTSGDDSYEIFEYKLRFGYHYQFTRNTLQLNRGVDRTGKPIFSDIASLAGVESTDWSWSSLFADFDNDGFKDLFITNGILKRPNDMDYLTYITDDSVQHHFTDAQFISKMPSGQVPDFLFRNKGNLTFENMGGRWMDLQPDISNGASYADLDNDGDLDLVINHIGQPASIYQNDLPRDSTHFINIKLKSNNRNTFGIGSRVIAYFNGEEFHHEQIPTRGWLSSVDYTIHVGLGKNTNADSIKVIWPGGKFQTLKNVNSGQTVQLEYEQAKGSWNFQKNNRVESSLLEEVNESIFVHRENNFVALNNERLMPHMVSTQGPDIAVGDINMDGLDDFFIGGGKGQAGAFFLQRTAGKFTQVDQPVLMADSLAEDTASALFDIDGDRDDDLLVVGGGQEYNSNSKYLLPRLYINNGKGIFKKAQGRLPQIFVEASCVSHADFDNDGDQDAFIGGRVVAGKYGINPSSYLLVNDGKGNFSDRSADLLPLAKDSLGMITDAVWRDLNGDGLKDMVLTGEWMPITILIQQKNGKFENQTEQYGLKNTEGWWNSLAAADFDKDGDIDFVAGNLGLNSRLKASTDEPIELFVGDFDENGGYEQILTYYNKGIRYPFVSRDNLVKQIPSLKRKFLKYDDFKNVRLEDIIDKKRFGDVVYKKAVLFSSVYLENSGTGRFIVHELPQEAQMFPIFAFGVSDVNHDGNLDIVTGGNLFSVQPDFGRYDAGYGLVMLGNARGNFVPVSPQRSGFIVKGEVRDIEVLITSSNEPLYLVARNNNSLMIFKPEKP